MENWGGTQTDVGGKNVRRVFGRAGGER